MTPKPDAAAAPPLAAGGSGKYIPPSQRGEGKKGESMSQSRLNGKHYLYKILHVISVVQSVNITVNYGTSQ